jgi:hypothetical protein
MGAFMVFVNMVIVAMVDPIIGIGAALLGAFVRPFWYAVLAGLIWGLLVIIGVAELARGMQERLPAILFATQTTAAVLDTLLIWWIFRIFRRTTASKKGADRAAQK